MATSPVNLGASACVSPFRERRLQREEKYDKNLKEKDKKEKHT
jgi:hypothetical protein